MLPNVPSAVVWVVGLPLWIMIPFNHAYLAVAKVISFRSGSSELEKVQAGWYGYTIAFLLHFMYLVGFLYVTDYSFELSFSLLSWIALPVGITVYAVRLSISKVISGKGPTRVESKSQLIYWLPVLPIAVIEELFYRGVLYGLHATHGPVWFVAVSALVFGFAHITLGLRETATKVFDGAMYAIILVVTGSLAVPLFLHLGYNVGYLLSLTRLGDRYR